MPLAPSLPFASFGAALCVAYAWPDAATLADSRQDPGDLSHLDQSVPLLPAAWNTTPY